MKRPLKDLNGAPHAGLDAVERKGSKNSHRSTIKAVKGRPRFADFDNVEELIAKDEEDRFKVVARREAATESKPRA